MKGLKFVVLALVAFAALATSASESYAQRGFRPRPRVRGFAAPGRFTPAQRAFFFGRRRGFNAAALGVGGYGVPVGAFGVPVPYGVPVGAAGVPVVPLGAGCY